MPDEGQDRGLERAGRALRGWRERRRLTLEAAANMTAAQREPLSKSYLYRLEAGQTSPSVSRLSALAGVYGVPTSVLVELFDTEERLAAVDVDVAAQAPAAVMDHIVERISSGDYLGALAVTRAALSPPVDSGKVTDEVFVGLLQSEADCLLHLGEYESAKSRALQLLERPGLGDAVKIDALYIAATACSHLKLFTAAFALAEYATRTSGEVSGAARTLALLDHLMGNLCERTGDHSRALEAYGAAIRGFESAADTLEACRSRINLTSTLISLGDHDAAASQLQSALVTAEAAGFKRLVALALSNLVLVRFHQGLKKEARTTALRSNELAQATGYAEVFFRNTFYLEEIARAFGDEAAAAMYSATLRRRYREVDPDLPEASIVRERLASGESADSNGGAA